MHGLPALRTHGLEAVRTYGSPGVRTRIPPGVRTRGEPAVRTRIKRTNCPNLFLLPFFFPVHQGLPGKNLCLSPFPRYPQE